MTTKITFHDKQLLEAVKNGRLIVATSALASGANPNIADPVSLMPLTHFSVNAKRYDLLRALLEHGADVEARDRDWRRLLRRAVEDGHLEAVKILVGHRANVNETDSVGDTLLHSACARGRKGPAYFAIAKDLLDAGASPAAKNQRGEIPLHHAARYGGERIARFMAGKSALNAPDADGHAPLHAAALGIDNEDGVGALLDAGVELDSKDRNGQTPLHLIAGKPKTRPADINVARTLLAKGSNPWTRDRDGLIAHDVASSGFEQRREVHQELVLLLKPKGKEPPPEPVADFKGR
jgi:serine/threonine-protein phosphatase 6 regulatory ankyrin repeat subunit A